MKRNYLMMCLIALVVLFAGCKSPESNVLGDAPVITDSFFTDATYTTITNTADYRYLPRVNVLYTNTRYYQIICFQDFDMDTELLELSKTKNFTKNETVKSAITQLYSEQHTAIPLFFEDSDISSFNSMYTRLKDSNGNYSNIFEIRNISIQ